MGKLFHKQTCIIENRLIWNLLMIIFYLQSYNMVQNA